MEMTSKKVTYYIIIALLSISALLTFYYLEKFVYYSIQYLLSHPVFYVPVVLG